MVKAVLIALGLSIGFGAAASEPQEAASNANQFFSIYAEGEDFPALLAFYDDNATLEDMIYGHYADGIDEIRAFLNWEQGDFTVLGDLPALVVQRSVVEGNTVVATGYFNRFRYYGKESGPWRFVTWLVFNEEGKIVKQID